MDARTKKVRFFSEELSLFPFQNHGSNLAVFVLTGDADGPARTFLLLIILLGIVLLIFR